MKKEKTKEKTREKGKKVKAEEKKVILARIDRKSDRRQEWRFELPLSALVEGKLPKGDKFQEKTIIENISSGGAYFSLDSGVTLGSKLNLSVDIPEKITGGKKTTIHLGGLTVRLEKLDKKGKKQMIALSFDEDFQFLNDED
ncbi:MAG: PilZ domain-containing protein [Candidatus Aminicenantes bacterium]|nr:PilZ domain-containing protein [Candidatus Aminicenantes bacterium]